MPQWLIALLVLAAALLIVLIAVVAVAARSYKTFYIPSAANEPTLRPGDRIVVRKGHGGLHRGDVIVYKATAPCSETPDQIKRVVAIAGDRVSSSSGKLFVNGQPASESYLARGTRRTT
jgi:signal peptidase I